LRKILVAASCIGLFCSLIGVALARHFLSIYRMPLSTAGLVVSLIGIAFVIVLLGQRIKGRLTLSRESRIMSGEYD